MRRSEMSKSRKDSGDYSEDDSDEDEDIEEEQSYTESEE